MVITPLMIAPELHHTVGESIISLRLSGATNGFLIVIIVLLACQTLMIYQIHKWSSVNFRQRSKKAHKDTASDPEPSDFSTQCEGNRGSYADSPESHPTTYAYQHALPKSENITGTASPVQAAAEKQKDARAPGRIKLSEANQYGSDTVYFERCNGNDAEDSMVLYDDQSVTPAPHLLERSKPFSFFPQYYGPAFELHDTSGRPICHKPKRARIRQVRKRAQIYESSMGITLAQKGILILEEVKQ